MNKQTPKHSSSDGETAIRLQNISKTFSVWEKGKDSIRNRVFNFYKPNYKRQIKALQDIDLEVKKGEFVGIIGRNGSGKSTLLKIILGAITPDANGQVEVNGKIIRLALGMGFDPGLTARENVYLNASLLGLTFKRIGQVFHQIIEFAELEKFTETKVKFFSSGMRSRLAFSIAVHAKADIFLIDEFFGGVGDKGFQEKSAKVFHEAILQGRTIILVSHQMRHIREFCDRVYLLDRGRLLAAGTPEEVLPQYQALFDQKNIKTSNTT